LPSIVPRRVQSLLGRDEDRARVASLLKTCRFVTLTGPGGIGKTSLARAVLADLDTDCAWFVDLAGVVAERDVPQAAAATLGLVDTEADDAEAALLAYLRTRDAVLVLDNLEQLAGIGHRIRRWLDGAPDLRILGTSRLPLGVAGEVDHPLSGLGLPGGTTPDEVEASPAGQLFLRTARRLGALETVQPDTAHDLATLLSRLDGMPLAIELAAGRSRVLTPSGLLRRLDDPTVLAATFAGGPEHRQGSLDRVLAMTLNLLPAAERRLLALLSVCPGSFDLDIARALDPDTAVVPALDRLVAAGLVVPDGEVAGETRFRLLETIRGRAGRELGPAEGDAARERHAAATIVIAQRAQRAWALDERGSRARLDAEHENIAAAVEWAIDHDVAGGLRLLAAIHPVAQGGVNLERSVRWSRAMLARAPADDPNRLFVTGSLLRLLTRYAGPREALKLEREVLDAVETAPAVLRRVTYLGLAFAYYALGDLLAAARFNELGAAAAEDPDDAEGLRLDSEGIRAWVGDHDADRAAVLYGREAAAHARAGRTFNQGLAMSKQALLELRAGRPAPAIAQARAAVALLPSGNVRAFGGSVLALALAEHGEPEAARHALAAAWPDVEREARIDRIEVLEAAVALLAAEGRHASAITALAVADRERPGTGWQRDTHIEFLLDRWRRRALHELGPLQASLAVADAIPATIERVIAGALAPHRPPRVARTAGPANGLTAREVEVLALVAQGRSDGEIAAELFISRKTASVHVTNIKGKLGLDTRLQVALHARAIGLAAGGSEPAVI
jgi:predicted ATPase/DNA-binding NarL/FixJ family response regulator